MFAPLKTGRKTNASKIDNDNDGRIDEDGPEDLNKDGVISMMRVKDPLGPYMIHPDDPRLLRRADAQKGERGGYAVYWEGTDNDGDGFYNEDGAGGVDINRNFQHQYPYYQVDAGPHMASEAETRGVLDYMLARRNIAAVLTFGESDNLIAPPTRTGAHAPASVLDLVGFANQSVAGARDVGRFETPQAFGGRGGRGFGGGGDDQGAAGRGGGRGAAGGGRGTTPPATTVNAADVEYIRTDQRSVSPGDRRSLGSGDEDSRRRLLRIRLLPVRRAGILDAWVGPASESCARRWARWCPAGRPAPRDGPAAPVVARRWSRRAAGDAPGGDASASGTAAIDLRVVRWFDADKIDGFIAWQPFKHPTLGEIGDRRLQALRRQQSSRLAHCRTRQVAHGVRDVSLVALSEGGDRRARR